MIIYDCVNINKLYGAFSNPGYVYKSYSIYVLNFAHFDHGSPTSSGFKRIASNTLSMEYKSAEKGRSYSQGFVQG
jgi:hypothetical protein